MTAAAAPGVALLRARLASQLLSGTPKVAPEEVVGHLLAVQAQDPRGARLAVRARSRGLCAADVDRALTDTRSLLITWLNRGTLHLVRSQDYPWLQALTTPPLRTGNARRLAQEGVSPAAADRGVAVIERALTRDGPLTRADLRERIAAAGVPTAGQALVHILMLACLRGVAVRGPMVGSQQAFVLVRDWLGPQPRIDRGMALAELGRRYLTGHGPADVRDLARWSGLPLRDARIAFAAIAPETTERRDGLVVMRGGGGRAPALPPPRLLGPFDPVLLGWVSRAPIVGAHQVVVTDNGLFRPFAMVEGRAVATWAVTGPRISLTPFAPLGGVVTAALEADAAAVVRFLGRS